MTATARLVAVLTSRHDLLREHAPGARRGTVVGVHQARVATRRLREVVPVAAVHLAGVRRRRLRRALRDMTRALGGVRECDVALDMVAALDATATPVLRASLRSWTRRLRDRRRDARITLLEVCSADRVAKVGGWLDRLVDTRAASQDDAWRNRLARLLDRRAQALRLAIAEAGVVFVPDLLHEVRIAAKRLRYAIELVGDCGVASVGRTLATLKRAQDVLGHLHDLDVLLRDGPWTVAPAGATSRAAAGPDAWAPLVAMLDAQRRHLHASYLRRRDALVRVADHARDVLVLAARRDVDAEPRGGADAA